MSRCYKCFRRLRLIENDVDKTGIGPDRTGPDHRPDHGSDQGKKKFKIQNSRFKIEIHDSKFKILLSKLH